MAFDPENPTHLDRLVRGVKNSRKKLRVHRELRAKFQREYVGRLHSDRGAVTSVPVNLVEQFVNVYKRALVPTLPSAFVTVSDRALLGTRTKLELGINHLAREIDLETTLELAVFDALLMMAIVKVGLTEKSFRYRGFLHDTGQPFVDHILFDDWVHDYAAKSSETFEYAGDRTYEPLEKLRDTYPKHADALDPASFRRTNDDGDERGDPIDRTLEGEERVGDYGGVYSLWMPEPNLILILPEDKAGGIRPLVLETIEWQGPERGPYHMLGFETLPGSTIPLSPISTVFEMAELHKALFNKSSSQAENQKTVIGARRSSHADATKLINADDMEVVTVDDPSLIKDFRFNGADPQTLQMGILVRQLFSQFSGNLDLLGGIAPQSETLGQDKLLAANASQRVKGMQKRVNRFVKGIFSDLAFWLFTDPRIELPLVKPNPGSAQGITLTLTAEDMEGDFLDYNIDINPYSMQSRTPEEELNLLMSILTNMVFPFKDDLREQGVTVNFRALLKRVGELANLKTMDEFLMFLGPGAKPSGSVGSPPTIQFPGGGAQPGSGNRDFQAAGSDMASMLRMVSGQGARQEAS